MHYIKDINVTEYFHADGSTQSPCAAERMIQKSDKCIEFLYGFYQMLQEYKIPAVKRNLAYTMFYDMFFELDKKNRELYVFTVQNLKETVHRCLLAADIKWDEDIYDKYFSSLDPHYYYMTANDFCRFIKIICEFNGQLSTMQTDIRLVTGQTLLIDYFRNNGIAFEPDAWQVVQTSNCLIGINEYAFVEDLHITAVTSVPTFKVGNFYAENQ